MGQLILLAGAFVGGVYVGKRWGPTAWGWIAGRWAWLTGLWARIERWFVGPAE